MANSDYFNIFFSGLLNLEIFVIYYSSLISNYSFYFKVLLFTFLGSLFWSQITFFIGKFISNLIDKKNKYIAEKVNYVHNWANKYSFEFILVFRYIYGFKLFSPIILGILNFEIKLFTILNFFSSFLWSLLFCNIGYFFGKYMIIDCPYKYFLLIILLNILISIFFSLIIYIYEKYRKKFIN